MMIMRIKSSLFISLCLILLTMSITAQDKQLSLHDLIPGGKTYSRFVPRDLKQLQWCGDEYLYVKGDSVLGAQPGKKGPFFVGKTEWGLDGGKSADGWFFA